jgi:SAM-dependent methyltransferase
MKTYLYEGSERNIQYFVDMIELSSERVKEIFDMISGDKILDIGCNIGNVSILLCEKGFDVVGIDLFEDKIEIANDLKKELGIESDRLIFKQMDFLKSDCEFEDDYFDCVLFLETIEHVENPVAFLKECRRVLKSGGYLLISTPNAINTYYILKQMYPKFKRLFWLIDNEPRDTGTHMDHIFAWDIFTFYRLLNRTGFKYVEHKFAGLEIPFLGRIPFQMPVLSRFSRTMIFKVQKV